MRLIYFNDQPFTAANPTKLITEEKLDKRSIENISNLTPIQEGMLYHNLNKDDDAYYVRLFIHIDSVVDTAILQAAWQEVVNHNEALRTVMRWRGLKSPVQITLKRAELPFLYKDITDQHLNFESSPAFLNNTFDNFRFYLTGQLFRISLFKLDDNQYTMVVGYHHLICDGWSNGILLKEFFSTYNHLSKQERPFFSAKARLSEFVKHTRKGVLGESLSYWQKKVASFSPADSLGDTFQIKGQSSKHREISFVSDSNLSRKINAFLSDSETSIAELTYACWGLLLCKLSFCSEIIFGTTVSGRNVSIKNLENTVGLFINTLPFGLQLNHEENPRELLLRVKEDLISREPHVHVPLAELKRMAKVMPGEELFRSLVIVENYPLDLERLKSGSLSIHSYEMEEYSEDELTLIVQVFERPEFTLVYDEETISQKWAADILEYFERIVHWVISNPDTSLQELNLISANEKEQFLKQSDDLRKDIPNETIIDLFEKQATLTPDAPAVWMKGQTLSYQELNKKANRLANFLIANEVENDDLIAISVERGIEQLVALMGTLKSGAAYVPIPTSLPEERKQLILREAQPKFILAEEPGSKITSEVKVIHLKVNQIDRSSEENPKTAIAPDHLAYAIFTSGSTGIPKGVLTEHKGVYNLIRSLTETYGIDHSDRILLFNDYSFDASVEQIWLALCNGAELFLLQESELLNKDSFESFLQDQQITHFDSTPSFLKHIEPGQYDHLRRVIVGGESCNWSLAEKWSGKYDFFNAYGPTETTVTSIINAVDLDQRKSSLSVPIGQAIQNTQTYVLDEALQLQPPGVAGELYIGGTQLARGYLNQPELTRERFIESPFKSGERLYKTGDRARWTRDGNIEFLGRNDDQVKIRGFRIELGEIERQLSNHPAITSAVVLAHEKQQDKYLVAYYTASKTTTDEELKSMLREQLPDYMIPSVFMKLEELPLNRSGKVDRKALPKPEVKPTEEFVSPANEIEEKLVEIWSEVLQISKDQISTTSNFFELGGHSLKATLVVNQLLKKMEVEIPVRDLFVHQDIQRLGAHIQDQTTATFESIPLAPEQENYPLTSAQKRLYFLYEFDREATAYNMPYVLKLTGELQVEKLENAFAQLIQRHESLRTRFVKEGETAFQQIVPVEEVDFQIEQRKLTSDETAEEYIKKFIRPFDLSQAPLFRIALLQLSEEEHLLMSDWHHIITDGTSQTILIEDFMEFYGGKTKKPLEIQYKDYAVWKDQEDESVQESLRNFWTESFEAPVEAIELPTDYPRSSPTEKPGGVFTQQLNKADTEILNDLAKQNGATVFMTLLALLNVLLSKLSNQKDVVIGTPVAGRDHADTQPLIGLFINTLALRNFPEHSLTFSEFLKEIKDRSLKAFEHSQYPFEELIENLHVTRTTNRNPLFDVMFALQNFQEEELELPGLRLESQVPQDQLAKFDLSITAAQQNDQLEISWEYDSSLFESETIERFASYLETLIEQVGKNADQKLQNLSILTQEEEQQLQKFNATAKEYPLERSVVELFEGQARKTPDKTAVIFQQEELTYGLLDEKSNRLANTLIEKGTQPNDIIGVLLEQSLEVFIAILAIHKAGAAFLPIDPSLPKDRINYMLEDSQTKIVLSDSAIIRDIDQSKQVWLDVNDQDNYSDPKAALPYPKAQDLAYVIYTSGTTGTPKGTLIEHGSLTNLCYWFNETYEVTEKDHTTKLAGLGFDATIFEIFPPLLKGATIHLFNQEDRLNPTKLNAYFEENNISLSFLPTPLCEQFIKLKNTSLKVLLTGGDKLNNASHDNNYKLYNNYGPTETTVVATSYWVTEDQINIPIGKPIANTQTYVLDEALQLQPPGVAGELYIGGTQLARGYLNQPELTRKRFIESPFKSGERLYKTGDRARWTRDGNIEFLGRNDDQVKIRGFRIELGEIERQLSNHPAITSAAVLAHEKQQDKYLVAYFTASETTIDEELKTALREQLPDYMIPSIFMELEELPLNRSGKVDRKALPKPEVKPTEEFVSPENEIEEKLLEIWSEVLQIPKEQISTTNNFFELGGHSLKATLVVNQLLKKLEVEIPVRDLFVYQDIQRLGAHIQDQTTAAFESIPLAPEQAFYPLTSAQRRLYFLYEFDREATAYNMPYVLKLTGSLDITKLEYAFEQLIQRHESLRTRFVKEGETAFQQIVPVEQVDFQIEKLTLASNETAEASIKKFIRSFDLSQAPLFRIALLQLSEEEHLFLTDWHHIITDGTSQAILIKDFMEFYGGKTKKPLEIQYKDYAVWKDQEDESVQESLRNFWTESFEVPVEAIELPTDYLRSSTTEKPGGVFTQHLNKADTEILNDLAKQNGATVFMTMLALLNVLLSKLSNQKDVVIGTPVAGRDHADTQPLIGLFINTLALRNFPEPDLTFSQFLNEIKDRSLKAFEHSQYPFEELIENLHVTRTTNRNPLFDVMFALQNFQEEELQLPGLRLEPQAPKDQLAKFDLSITAAQQNDQLEISWEYDSSLFESETIKRFASYLETLIEQVGRNADQKLQDLSILTQQEEQQLHKFNATAKEYPLEISVVELFEGQARKKPDKTAVVFQEEELTYGLLDEKSNRLAYTLIKKGTQPNDIIGVLLEQSVEVFMAILAIQKAGAAFLPIDPSLPKDRINYMLEDSQAKIVLSDSTIIRDIDLSNQVWLDVNDQDNYGNPKAALTYPKAQDLAYVIYTSGTTGEPKGTLIEHGSLTNLCYWFNETYKVTEKDHTTKLAGLGFDATIFEIFPPLLKGATIHLFNQEDRLNPTKLNAYFEENNISISFLPTPLCEQFINLKNTSLRILLTGGDKLNKASHDNNYKLYNNYGPTETTVVATSYLVTEDQTNIPIGQPIANTQTYILNEALQFQPPGVAGELYIGGTQLARGYLNQPELTRERFIESPFKSGERLYKTGDRARWTRDGNIEFLGRNDDQFKIRGFRIELGEIERQLSNHPAITSAVVLAHEKQQDKYLVAYYTTSETTIDEELKTALREQLPDYMIPSIFMELEELPLNRSGKVDRKALPKPEFSAIETYVGPENETEKQLVAIWSEILHIPATQISTKSNFFEMGGHSLKAVMIIDKIHLEMGIKLPVIDFFNRQTIKELAELIQAIQFVNVPKVEETNQIEITL